MSGLTDEESKAVLCARTMTPLTLTMVVETIKREALAARLTCDHEAQIRDLLEERKELLTEIRRLRMGNHPAGRALRVSDAVVVVGHVDLVEHVDVIALREALEERDAGHEGGGCA